MGNIYRPHVWRVPYAPCALCPAPCACACALWYVIYTKCRFGQHWGLNQGRRLGVPKRARAANPVATMLTQLESSTPKSITLTI